MTYDQAREFCHQFIDSLLCPMLEQATDFEKERHLVASKEIMCEILRDKYQIPNREVSILLLHAGIELLEVVDAGERE